MVRWNPESYAEFADERARPFADLVRRIGAEDPSSVVDLGCGAGDLTTGLATRWSAATIVGLDSSSAMIERARAHQRVRVQFQLGDLRQWRPDDAVDVIISNAALQWVPEHRELLPEFLEHLRPGGWLAFQVPGNFGEPSHQLLRALARDDRFATATAGVEEPAACDAATYLDDLSRLDCRVDAWETTYQHVLTGPEPVFRWICGTGARPILASLSQSQRRDFVAEYKAQLNAAYPRRGYGTVLPFRRVFAVAQKRR